MAKGAKKKKAKHKYKQTPWEKKHNKAPIDLLVRRYERLGRTIAEHGRKNFPK